MSDLEILNYEPFVLGQEEKGEIFLNEIKKALLWHFQNSPEFKKLCDNRGFSPEGEYCLEEIPYLPATIFKLVDLLSVPKEQVIRTLFSSSTSGRPSKIMLDKITAERQVVALNKILAAFLGRERRHFIIFDTEETVKSTGGELSSRGTAIRGMLSLAKKISFVLDKDLQLDLARLQEVTSQLKSQEKICYFGFTWLIYNVYSQNKANSKVSSIFSKVTQKDKFVLHIGGWKRLQDMAFSKEDFNQQISAFLQVDPSQIIDFYGMTEQLGTVYPDCPEGNKHIPVYSEIIIRDVNTLRPVKVGKVGFIQLLSPLPHSYPGVSVLSDDLGRVVGIDDCPCGRKGKYFVFEKRSEKAELRGCGDTLKLE